ncbi:hypothetical protein EGJ57_21840 [Brucella anthropi]|nr:hypothetical protein EGJ57_21840 [Brucella anthropi]
MPNARNSLAVGWLSRQRPLASQSKIPVEPKASKGAVLYWFGHSPHRYNTHLAVCFCVIEGAGVQFKV